MDEYYGLMDFTGLTFDEVNHCFVPFRQDRQKFGGVELMFDPAPIEIAKNIRRIIKIRLNEKRFGSVTGF
ncbi:MAG: hypothetical protein Q8L81_08985 [Bacteroidota bacterium]|nr:hypothetical protein [Bacteroidota bacterium]